MESLNTEYDLLLRMQRYVANDVNSKLPPEIRADNAIEAKDVYVMFFARVGNCWRCAMSVYDGGNTVYELIHNSIDNRTQVNVFEVKSTHPAII